MPPRSKTTTIASATYWQHRVRSPAFARELTALLRRELRALADRKFKDVMDVRLMRELIERSDEVLAVDAVAALVVNVRATLRRRLRKSKRSLRGLLGEQFVADIESALDEATHLTGDAEDLIARMMERELVQSLLTDLVYTAIESFNRRVNPLFGTWALMAVDAQIKSFIRMFMPMLQRQATAFLIDRDNSVLFADFVRAVTREILNEPLRGLLELFAGGTEAETEALIKKTARNPRVRRLVRVAALALHDAMFHALGGQRVGSVLLLDENIDWLAQRFAAPLLATLAHPPVATFVAREIDRALTQGVPVKAVRKSPR